MSADERGDLQTLDIKSSGRRTITEYKTMLIPIQNISRAQKPFIELTQEVSEEVGKQESAELSV